MYSFHLDQVNSQIYFEKVRKLFYEVLSDVMPDDSLNLIIDGICENKYEDKSLEFQYINDFGEDKINKCLECGLYTKSIANKTMQCKRCRSLKSENLKGSELGHIFKFSTNFCKSLQNQTSIKLIAIFLAKYFFTEIIYS